MSGDKSPPGEQHPTHSLAPPASPGDVIGDYRILQRIGEGGMGEVYEAEQEKPVRRRVALKLIKWGMDTRQVVARFESERQALALMNHANIAKVFDAGATEQGRPFFVMEYVKGEPITLYCDRHQLSTRERLGLFMMVCEGVQHAHQKGIIHRDIKPANVLVTVQDGKPMPKIIDFGVAKATAQPLTERTVFTELGQLIGTPEFMSPEQAEMTGLDIDTRSDVYSLGLVLYELLVGALPFDAGELRRVGFDEIRRRIREVEPPKPSARLSTLGGGSASAAAKNRRTEPLALTRQLRGDLDWITMRALEKDRTRRYASASEIAADLERHLKHQPVLAGPPGAVYRLAKFVRRHRVGVGSAAVLLAVLVVFAVMMAVQAGRIARERDRANDEARMASEVSDFLMGLFKVPDPSESRGNSVTAREVLDRGADAIGTELRNQPALQARMLFVMGSVYEGLGLYRDAEPLLARAVELQRKILEPGSTRLASSLLGLAWLYRAQARYEEALPLTREALAIQERAFGPDHPETARALRMQAIMLRDLGRYDEAKPLFQRALSIQETALGSDHTDTARTQYHLAWLLKLTGGYEEARRLLERALPVFERNLGPDHPAFVWCLNDLGVVMVDLGEYRAALRMQERVLSINEKLLGPDHPDLASALNNLGTTYWYLDRHEEAQACYERVVSIRERALGPEHPHLAGALNNLAMVLGAEGHYAEARALFERSLDIEQRALGLNHPAVADTLQNFSDMVIAGRRYAEAEELLGRCLAIREETLGPEHPSVAIALESYATLLRATGREGEARAAETRAAAIRKKPGG